MVLQDLVAVVDAQLLEGILRENLKTKDVQQTNRLTLMIVVVRRGVQHFAFGINYANYLVEQLVVHLTSQAVPVVARLLYIQRDSDGILAGTFLGLDGSVRQGVGQGVRRDTQHSSRLTQK